MSQPARQELLPEGYMRAGEHSLFLTIFNWYQNQKGFQAKKLQNFCYYFWHVVLLIPLYWFFSHPIYRGVRPWMVVATGIWLGLTVLFEFVRYFTIMVIICAVAFVLLIVTLVLAKKGIDQYFSDQFEKYINKPTKFLWFDNIVPLWKWLWLGRITTHIRPWMFVAAGVYLSLCLEVGFREVTLTLAVYAVTIAIIVGAAIGVIVLAIGSFELWVRMRKKGRTAMSEQDMSSVAQTIAFVKAKKRRICPIIVLPGQEYLLEEGDPL